MLYWYCLMFLSNSNWWWQVCITLQHSGKQQYHHESAWQMFGSVYNLQMRIFRLSKLNSVNVFKVTQSRVLVYSKGSNLVKGNPGLRNGNLYSTHWALEKVAGTILSTMLKRQGFDILLQCLWRNWNIEMTVGDTYSVTWKTRIKFTELYSIPRVFYSAY